MQTKLTSWRGRSRFYETVRILPSALNNKQWSIHLDNFLLKTPTRRSPVTLPNRTLACLVGLEFDSQIRVLEPGTMPLTMLSVSALELVEKEDRKFMEGELERFVVTDLVCFPLKDEEVENEDEEMLAKRQKMKWIKPMEHFETKYGTLSRSSGKRLGEVPRHPKETKREVEKRIGGMTSWEIVAALSLAQACKSLVIPLGVLDGAVSVEEAIDAVRVEEEHQIERWGMVEGGHDVDLVNVKTQILAASLLHRLSSLPAD